MGKAVTCRGAEMPEKGHPGEINHPAPGACLGSVTGCKKVSRWRGCCNSPLCSTGVAVVLQTGLCGFREAGEWQESRQETLTA